MKVFIRAIQFVDAPEVPDFRPRPQFLLKT